MVLTGDANWGGWRVPGAEYALSPARIERQARMMVWLPQLLTLLRKARDWGKGSSDKLPDSLLELLRQSNDILNYLDEDI